jgi:DNA-binding transcriptional regulator YiaG
MKRKGRPRGEAMSGEELRRVRRRLGLTQVELAKQLGTAANTVARWERGVLGIGEPVARLVRFVASSNAPRRRRRTKHGAR